MARRKWQQLELPVVRDAEPTAAPYRTRPARRRRNPPAEMSNAELLSVLLGTRTAAILVATQGGLPNLRHLATSHPADLRDAGMPAAGLRRFDVLFELARRYGETEWIAGEPFKGSYDVYAHFRERLAAETVEFFMVVLLDNRHRRLKDVIVGQGSLTASMVHPRDVYRRIVRDAAAAVIFVHNHPSGDPTPSREDLEITRRLREVGELIGVKVLDHIIIGKGRYVSFVDDGYW
jgi:DNA repair protein RadC